MQQNQNDMPQRTTGSQSAGTQGGTGGIGGRSTGSDTDRLGANLSDTTGDRSASAFSDTSGTLGRESLEGGAGSRLEQTTDEAREKLGQAKEKLGQAKDRASNLKATLADKLDAGAGKLRNRTARASVAEAGAEAETTMRKAGHRVASGMENTAEWLRNTDVQSLRSGIENQVRAKPGRTLLVALGLGYVIGRVLRGKREM
jgi:hypothetical protein